MRARIKRIDEWLGKGKKTKGGGVITPQKLAELIESGKPVTGGFLVCEGTLPEKEWQEQAKKVTEYQQKLLAKYDDFKK